MKALKDSVDASAIPEYRLRQILEHIVSHVGEDQDVLLSIVYRVEVNADTLTIWTILDADPNGTIDLNAEGVTITSGIGFGVPLKSQET